MPTLQPPDAPTESRSGWVAFVCSHLKFKLGTNFVLLIVLILSVTMTANAFISYHRQQALFLGNLAEKAKVQGILVSSISKEAILSHDYTALNSYMHDVSAIEDIVYGVIYTPDRQNLTSYLNTENEYIKVAAAAVHSHRFKEVLQQLSANENIRVYQYPVTLDNEVIATFNIGVDEARIIHLTRSELFRQLASSDI